VFGTVTSWWRLAGFNTGDAGTFVQLDAVRSVFCCSMKFRDGINQERTRVPPEVLMPSSGEMAGGERCSV
jgi:hypothetical protein